ncbi:glycosyltransferase family 4 protein [Formosa haliotis]|uniref:glycosyltransferase family 4 protein n=1 Tax=Formosa haliotis TaxID=1555194 RepID=UPI0008251ECB|nr:glycosyltransferase family 1 protein [Formosa haliotis]
MKDNHSLNYIFRKRLSQYNSIEELFYSINLKVSDRCNTNTIELPYSGGSPVVLFKNIKSLTIDKKNNIHHITGDVHYVALVTGKNTVLTIHDIGSAFQGNFVKQFYIKLFWFWLPALFVKRITVISEFTKLELSKLIPFASNKIRVIYNPVNSQLHFKPKPFNNISPRILLIGTKANKNLERTFEALKGISCELRIIGELSENHMALLKKYNITYVTRVNIDYVEVVREYELCDFVLFASTYEGFGMPIIEAQAVGRVVITSNLGAMKEVAKDSACLVNPYEVESIRNGIQKVVSDGRYRNILVDKGIKNVERFSLENISNAYIELYKSILN